MNSPLPPQTRILIVGSGPSGLAAGISMLCNGIQPSELVIVDSVEKGSNTSRAIAIHAATLEVNTDWKLGDKNGPFFQSSFEYNSRHTKYPFFLSLSQKITEHVLEERLNELGVKVLRPFHVSGMKESPTGKGMDVLFESGEIIKAEYVIGADGARSTVRRLSDIKFADPDGKSFEDSVESELAQMVMADVSFSSPLPDSPSLLTATRDGMFLLMSLGKPVVTDMLYNSSETVYRIGFSEHINRYAPLFLSSDPTVNPNPINITKMYWTTRFRLHSAIAEVFFKRIHGGFIFLVGDAAHIHSPAGGQGMNLGLRDALGLGPVLAEHVLKGSGGDLAALESYATLRRIRGLNMIQLTKRLLSAINFVMQPHYFDWPAKVIRLLSRISLIQRKFAYQLSGLGNP
ncbi:hypothetical protein BDP27DRAFT_1323231 [Rhodocollybia butyracea]|uniref:FAD-binding domain-containing protein n=1 Tax=Rhodocollybia butyracea TaxID=206335 RepID=A0A9P5U976_9AGAR|nr:hypothetical protein BDP27DRAFT_1323231 [Rhodocollybia butyracea]